MSILNRLSGTSYSTTALAAIVVFVAINPACVLAQLNFEAGESSLDIDNPHPTLFSGSKVDGYDYLEATLDVENKGATVSWAPFLMRSNYNMMSETRFQLAQKDSVTSLGVSFKYNPFNPRGTAAQSVFQGLEKPKPRDTDGLLAARVRRIIAIDKQIPQLLSSGSEACESSPETIKRAADEYRQVVQANSQHVQPDLANRIRCSTAYASSLQLKIDSNIECLEDKLNHLRHPDEADSDEKYRCYDVDWSFDGGNSITVTEATLAEFKKRQKAWKGHLALMTPAATRIYLDEHERDPESTTLAQLQAERASLQAMINAQNAKDAGAQYFKFREALYKSPVPIVTASYVTSFFEVLGGDDIDANGNMMNDNEHRIKSRVLSLAADWRFGEANQLSFILTRSNERASAEAGTPDADYDGLGATYSRRLLILNKDGYAKTKDYKESLFVPSINIGVAYERKDCDSLNPDCADGILRSQAITPFVDFKLRKTAQFRLGIPLKRTRLFMAGMDGEEDSVEFQAIIAFQLGAPK